MNEQRRVAYFSMEIGLEAGMPTYSGGLGILAGDTVRSAADLRVPMIAVTLLHRKGYFYQWLDASGRQSEEPVAWVVEDFLHELPNRASVTIEGRTVQLRAWRYDVRGSGGFTVPVYFLDTDLPDNTEWDRTLTHFLYGGDQRYRLCQEVILGIGGVRMLRALGYDHLERFHMNEGHAGLLTLALLDEAAQKAGGRSICRDDIEAVWAQCIFTTHTPVPAGHDQFPMELVNRVLGDREEFVDLKDEFCVEVVDRVFGQRAAGADRTEILRGEGLFNLTYLALNLSGYINGVAKKHGEVSRLMFAGYTIDAITNGVHAATWAAEPLQQLYDRYIPGWRQDNFSLRYALSIPKQEVWEAHLQAKKWLLLFVNHATNVGMNAEVLTLGFARRATTYKRSDLLFLEASGTSGMRAALNGVPSLSILDGWWIEGHIEGVTGWSIGEKGLGMEENPDHSFDAASLYDKLERVILPLFYHDRERFIDVMARAIALNGSFFNTQRMVQEYVLRAYFC